MCSLSEEVENIYQSQQHDIYQCGSSITTDDDNNCCTLSASATLASTTTHPTTDSADNIHVDSVSANGGSVSFLESFSEFFDTSCTSGVDCSGLSSLIGQQRTPLPPISAAYPPATVTASAVLDLASQQVVDTSSLEGYTYSLPEHQTAVPHSEQQQQQLVGRSVSVEVDFSLNQLANVHIGSNNNCQLSSVAAVATTGVTHGTAASTASEQLDILSKAARSIMDPTAAGMSDDYFPGAKRLKSQNQAGLSLNCR